jgi:hypothetical protein
MQSPKPSLCSLFRSLKKVTKRSFFHSQGINTKRMINFARPLMSVTVKEQKLTHTQEKGTNTFFFTSSQSLTQMPTCYVLSHKKNLESDWGMAADILSNDTIVNVTVGWHEKKAVYKRLARAE